MASPHIAGAVALLWAAQPDLRGNIDLSTALLQDTALPLATSEACGGTASQVPNNTFGNGLLDVLAAVTANTQTNTAPMVTINSPVEGAKLTCPATVPLAAEATDAEDGDLSALVLWSDNGASLTPGQTSRSYACAEAGVHNLTAAATDSGGLTGSDTVMLEVLGWQAQGGMQF